MFQSQEQYDYDSNYLSPLTDPTRIKEIYDKYGMVGITQILNDDEINETITDIQSIIRSESGNKEFAFNNPETYDLANTCMNNYGTIGKKPLFSKILLRNRCHPNVRKAYSIVYGLDEKDLVCQHDRFGWMRPTIGPIYEDWTKYRTPFAKPGLHLDIDPKGYFNPKYRKEVDNFLEGLTYSDRGDFVKENNARNITMGLQLQGVLNLLPNNDLDGGFHGVPGGHLKLEDWYNSTKSSLDDPEPNGKYIFNYNKPIDNKLTFYTERIPCPPGTLIIFDATLPHGTKSNYSQNNRMIQFLRYMPKATLPKKNFIKRNIALKKLCDEYGFEPTDDESSVLFV